jgi:hypothetical protein
MDAGVGGGGLILFLLLMPLSLTITFSLIFYDFLALYESLDTGVVETSKEGSPRPIKAEDTQF